MGMFKQRARFFLLSAFALSFSSVHAQSTQQVIQQVVDAELASIQKDHSKWVYFQETQKPKVQFKQWVATTQQGNIERILEKDGQRLSEPEQRDRIQKFLHDTKAQKKQLSTIDHDYRQIADLLKLLPVAFVWIQTDATATTTSLHFDPAPQFQPPTLEARVFSGMTGDLVVDNQQHRVCSMKGHLLHDVKFGGGLLGRLKQGSSFSLKQEQVGPSLWQLTSIEVQFQGNALFFKSVSLQEDDEYSKFQLGPSGITLEQAAVAVMKQPDLGQEQVSR
jgi:hypothetical protein